MRLNAFTFQMFKCLNACSMTTTVLIHQNLHEDDKTLETLTFREGASMPKPSPNNKPQKFKQRDLERAIRATRAMNVPSIVEIDPHTGKIRISPATADA